MMIALKNLVFVFTSPSSPGILRATFSKIFQKGKTNDANKNSRLNIRVIRGLIRSAHFAL